MSGAPPRSHVEALLDSLGFPLDRFQQDAADAGAKGAIARTAASKGARRASYGFMSAGFCSWARRFKRARGGCSR